MGEGQVLSGQPVFDPGDKDRFSIQQSDRVSGILVGPQCCIIAEDVDLLR